MTTADIKLARVRHWLGFEDDHGNTPVHTLSWEIEPSPDGTLEGQSTWYDYPDKPDPSMQGSSILPSVIARVMPPINGTNSTWYKYLIRNDLGRVTQSIEKWDVGGSPQYRTNAYTYDANGIDLIQHTGPDGAVDKWGYNSYHQPLYHTNALGGITSYTYNGNRQLASVTSPSGLVTTHTYNGSTFALEKSVESISGTPISTNTFARYPGQTYIRAGLNGVNVTNATTWLVTTDPRGLVVTNIIDSLGRLWERRSSGLVELSHYELFPSQSYSDSTGGKLILDPTALVKVVGGTNYSTNTWTYDAVRRLAYEEDALGTYTAWQYCDCGGPTQITRGYGLSLAETTTNAFNLVGWKTHTWFPGKGGVTNTFDLLGRVMTTTDALGSITNTYDNLGRLTLVKNAAGTVESRTYDVEDHLTLHTDHKAVTSTNTYDGLGRIKTRTLNGGVAEQWFYTTNIFGPLSYTNQIGRETLWTYDAAGRNTNEVLVGVMTNRFVYNGAGDLTDLYDGKQIGSTNRTQWRYDNHGRVTAKVYANNQTNLIYAYDPLSRLTNRWSQTKGNTKYAYDRRGSLTNVDYASSTDLKYQFDALGRLTNMIDAVGTTRYSYTNGLLSTEDGPWANDTVTWEYNHARMRSALRLQQTATHWWTNSYVWDAAHRLSSVTSPAGTFTYGYDGPGTLRTGYSAPGGSVTNLYDSQGRMTLTAWRNTSGTVLNAHGYQLDAAHQRTRQTRTNNAASHNHTLGYQYDAAGQVTHARATNNSTGLPVAGELLGLTYDSAWNMTARTNGATVNYGVNNLNQVTGDGGTYTYTYDNNGNRTYRTQAGGEGYVMMVYDDENQLVRQETDTSATLEGNRFKLEYLYDSKLRLRERKYSTWQYGSWYPTSTERYVYDGMLIVQERNTGTPAVTYTRGVDLSASLDGAGGIGGLLARSHGFNSGTGAWSTHSAYHADGNGNVTAMYSTSTGSQVAWYRYDAFGRLLQSSGSLASANRMRFSSKPWMAPAVDESAGMYCYGYRFYDPLTQRWLNRDPLGEPGDINLYRFLEGNPIVKTDPLGLDVWVLRDQCGKYGHEVVMGDNGDGTYWEADLNPGDGMLSPLFGSGVTSFNPSSERDPRNLAESCYKIVKHSKTCQQATDFGRKFATEAAENNDQPYDFFSWNCRHYARSVYRQACAKEFLIKVDNFLK